ncbi:MAG: hypothetical protein WA642_02720 [Steroidobacteraceae bacterium]
MSQRLLVVFNGSLVDWLGKSERCLCACISYRAVRGEPFLKHPQ